MAAAAAPSRGRSQAAVFVIFLPLSHTVCITYLSIRVGSVQTSLAVTQILVTHVGPCDDVDPSTLPLTLGELSVATQTIDSSLSGEFNLTQDIANGWKVKSTTQKCQDIRNVETCDFFSEAVMVADGCVEDNDDEEIYSMLFHYIEPEIECPITAGVYKLSDYPFFTEDNNRAVYEAKISTSVFGYTYKLEGYTQDEERVFCVEAYLQLQYMRDHNWTESRNYTRIGQTVDDDYSY